MPPTPPRPLRSASRPALPRGHRPAVPSTRSDLPAPTSNLKILAAGVDKDARGPVEAAVRRAFACRASSEAWSVSLVRLGGKWSVTLSGPGERFRNVSFTTDESRLEETIGERIRGDREGPAMAMVASPSLAPTRVQERHVCDRCHLAVLVVYESQPDEGKTRAPLACPHCWGMNHVEIGAWAAAGGDYRAEKA